MTTTKEDKPASERVEKALNHVTEPEIRKRLEYLAKVHPEIRNGREAVALFDTGYSWDEAGMAQLFSEVYSDKARFCNQSNRWHVYNGKVWALDKGKLSVINLVTELKTLLELYSALLINDLKIQKEFLSFIAKLGYRSTRMHIIDDAAGLMTIQQEEFDSNPFLLNCQNGTYDLEKGKFREHSPDDMLTMICACDGTLRQDVQCERWVQFIDEITEHDHEKAEYLQRALGYSILGSSKEECMFILHGKTTRNGKSTLLATIEHLLGEYSTSIDVTTIMRHDARRDENSATPILARLRGKRFVTMQESDSNGKLDEEVIKQYTGGEAITARELYCDAFTYTPQFTLFLSCNDLPAVKDESLFASERLRLIEFNRHFSKEEQDKSLKDNFKTPEAMMGIMVWLVEGYRKYKEQGLNEPACVSEATAGYKAENDTVTRFFGEKCEQCKDATIQASDLYRYYKSWCIAAGQEPLNTTQFGRKAIERCPWEIRKDTKGVTKYHGLRILG